MWHGGFWRLVWSGVVLWPALVGCGSSKTNNAAPAAQAKKPVEATQPVHANTPGPEVTVSQFLEAVRTGDDEQAANLLTRLAREKTQEMDMAVAPPGSDTASFTVGEVELLPNDVAHVASRWEDAGEHHDIVWALRREPEGWRIGGMVTKPFPDKELPLVLNFEDPADMLHKQQMVEEEMARRAQQAVQAAQAEQPAANLE